MPDDKLEIHQVLVPRDFEQFGVELDVNFLQFLGNLDFRRFIFCKAHLLV